MTKEFLIFILILPLFLFFPGTIQAFEPFVKSPNNPLTFTNDLPNWNEIDRVQPSVIFENGIYKMWYSTGNGNAAKIAYATSSDGLQWTRQNLFDLAPGFDNHDPSILKTPNGYTLFFAKSLRAAGGTFRLMKIDSTDGINFQSNTLQEILSPANALEGAAVSSPFIFLKNNSYYLFYLCWGNQGFSICMATSQDAIQWQRCPNNPIVPSADGPHYFETDNKSYLIFQSAPGLHIVESTNSISCTMTWQNRHTILQSGPEQYDNINIISPALVQTDDALRLYYSSIGSNWTINLATSPLTPNNPTKDPIVILPGLLASWNKDAILHKQNVEYSQWKLNPLVKEYKGIIDSLSQNGYQTDADFYFFSYDWRKKVEDISVDLNTFLVTNVFPSHSGKKINLVGHSLGGLVSRIYGQKYGLNNLNKIITVGSPHQGVARSYYAVEGGEFDRSDRFAWLAEKIILQLYKNKLETDKETLNKNMPILKDLFPIYPFLTDKNNNPINISNMQINNETFLSFNSSIISIFSSLQTMIGESGNTLSGFKVDSPTAFDQLLDLYPDGRPKDKKFEIGDSAVISRSAKADDDFTIFPLEHSELVYKTQGIKGILDSINLPYQESQIVEGEKTQVFPSLIFLILSPASIEVSINSKTYTETEGMIFIDNAQAGIYTLKVKGIEKGDYRVIVGQVGQNKDVWTNIEGTISQDPPNSQINSYTVSFRPDQPLDFPINLNNIPSLFDLLIAKIKKINTESENKYTANAIFHLQKAKESYSNSKFNKVKSQLIYTHNSLFKALKAISENIQSDTIDAVNHLENLYERSLASYTPRPEKRKLALEHKLEKKEEQLEQKMLLTKKRASKNIELQALLLLKAQEKLEQAEEKLEVDNLWFAEILLKSASEFIRLAKK